MTALTSSKYYIKWTQLADLPVPLYDAYVALQHHKIYVTGSSPDEDAEHQTYVYDVNTDQWGQLPPSGHYYGIPHIIGGKLVIIGGRLYTTKNVTNKVSTFDEDSHIWTSYYPDLLSVRSKPGVVSHLDHVIVAGGGLDDYTDHDDIEVLNWIEDSYWRKVAIKLPVPMFGFTPTIHDDHLLIVGYASTLKQEFSYHNGAYKIPIASIIVSNDQQHSSDIPIKLTADYHWESTLIPNSTQPVVIGGQDTFGVTADVKMYNNYYNSWKKIGSMSFARSLVAVAAVCDNAIIVIGGYTSISVRSSSLTLVELGQAELLH